MKSLIKINNIIIYFGALCTAYRIHSVLTVESSDLVKENISSRTFLITAQACQGSMLFANIAYDSLEISVTCSRIVCVYSD